MAWTPPEVEQEWTPPEAQPQPFTEADYERMTPAVERAALDEAQRRAISAGRESGTEFLSTVANDPVGAIKAIPQTVMQVLTAPGQLAYRAAADVVAKVPDFEMTPEGEIIKTYPGREFGGNLAAMGKGETPPVEEFLNAVAETNPKLAVVGKVGRDTAAMSGLGVVGLLPKGLAKLAAAGFTVDMIRHAPQQFREYADEIAKPVEEQDAGLVADLQSGIIQTFAFAPLAGKHAAKGVPEKIAGEIKYALDAARENTPNAPRAKPAVGRNASYPAEEGAPVPEWLPAEVVQAERAEVRSQKPEISPERASQSDVARTAEAEAAPRGGEPPQAIAPAARPNISRIAEKENAPTITEPAVAPAKVQTPASRTATGDVQGRQKAEGGRRKAETPMMSEQEMLASVSNQANRRPYVPLEHHQMEKLVAAGDVHGKGKRKGRLTQQGQDKLTEYQRQERVAADEEYRAAMEETETPGKAKKLTKKEERAQFDAEAQAVEQSASAAPDLNVWTRERVDRLVASGDLEKQPSGGYLGKTFVGRAFIEGVNRARTMQVTRRGMEAGVKMQEAARLTKPAETPAAAVAKVQEHVVDVASGEKGVKMEDGGSRMESGPRPAKEIKSELVQRLEKEIAKLGPEPELLYSDPITRKGKREFSVYSPDRAQHVVVRESYNGDWIIELPAKFQTDVKGKTTGSAAKELARSFGDIRAATRAAESAMQKLLGGDKKPVTIRIPGDGAFTIERTHAALNEVLRRAEALSTASGQRPKVIPTGRAENPAGFKRFTEEEWADPGIVKKLEQLLAATPESSKAQRGLFEEALRQAREMHGVIAPAMPSARAGVAASPPALGGGELGKTPPRPPVADDPRHSVFDAVPMELPEAVQMVKSFTGLYPKIRERLGDAAGLFRFTQGEKGKGQVELLARIFDLLDDNDKARLQQEAKNYADAESPKASASEKARVERERYEHLLDEAYEKAKLENPKQALKVIWHEIGHVVDWLPDKIIRGRGNFFGRIASLKQHLKHVLPLDPKRIGPFQEKPGARDLAELRKAAYKAVQDEIGPMREIVETIMVDEPVYRESGITPDMVKRLFGMDARETMPELYRWFAEQAADVKKEIVRAAMKGLVDERLSRAPVSGREQVGTRRVEKEVRRREGREPTPQEVEAKFKALFRAELERRNLAELATVKKELNGLIAWWRGTEKMPDYFKTSEEMYAEAFSVFANNPAALEARAPTYAKLIWNYLDRKPQVKELYDQVQAEIKSGAVMPNRVKALWQMWDTNDRHSLELARDANKVSGRDVLDNVQYHLDRRFGPIYRAARGTEFQGRMADAVGNFLYRMSEHERYLAALNEQVGKVLVRHNLDWSHDLGEYLFHNRVQHERFNLANPLGWTSKNSIERLAEMKATLGPERWAALEEAGRRYREQYEAFVVRELEAARMFSPELQQAIAERAHYATFAAAKNLPDAGIERMLESRYGASITPHIYRQVGNLGEIKNPATATVLKGLSLISAAYRNSMKREVVNMLRQLHPEDIVPARMNWNGKARVPEIIDNHPTVGTIVYLENGKPQAFNVRRVVSDAVNSATGADNLAYSLLLGATGWQKGVYTQLNYAFWPFNFIRDTLGWWMQMPGLATPYYWAKNLPRALVAARQSVTHSQPNPWADAALRRKMLISKGDPRGVWAAAENEFEVKLASFGMDPVQWSGQRDAVHRLVKAWDFYKNLGQTVERVNKINGMLYLDEKFPRLPEWKKREIVRERSGSPNFLERGASNPAVDLVFLFYNPWKEGVRSLAKSAKENPWSFAAKTTAAVLLPTIIQSAAVNGWLGDERKEQYASIPDFDLTNYLVVPLGWVDRKQRKVAYLRLPLWEPARIAHGTLFQALTPRGQGVAAHAGGQVPGLNPLWKVGLAWTQYALGKNPVDTTRAVNVMPDKIHGAGGMAAFNEMAKYSWNELGGSILHRFRNLNLEASPESEGEEFLALPVMNNALGRWIKVSDRGLADQQRAVSQEVGEARNEIQLGVDEILRRLTGEGSWEYLMQALQSGDPAALQRSLSAAQLTDAEKMLMRDPYALEYFTRKFPELVLSKANPNVRMWFNAQSNEERAQLLRRGIIQPALR